MQWLPWAAPDATRQPPQSGHLPPMQDPSPNPSKKELAKVLTALRLKRAQERRDLLQALGEREQFYSELSRMERHQESQIGTMTLQLTLLTHQLQHSSKQ